MACRTQYSFPCRLEIEGIWTEAEEKQLVDTKEGDDLSLWSTITLAREKMDCSF